MSRAWSGGSTRAWRRVRLLVLERDAWLCQLPDCLWPGQRMNPGTHRDDPRAPQVHHKLGKRYGDDPDHLEAAHRECNRRAGDPTRGRGSADPQPIRRTLW